MYYLSWVKKLVVALIVLCLVLCLSMIVCISVGSSHIPVSIVLKIVIYHFPGLGSGLVTPNWDPVTEVIVMDVRLPRIILGILVGAALAVAGATYQGLVRNPLAEPYTLGVSSGAAVGAGIVLVLGLQNTFLKGLLLPVTAFAGGLLATLAVYRLARIGNKIQAETLILAGVVMNAFMAAIFSFLVTIAGDNLRQVINWHMGCLALVNWQYVLLLTPYVLVCFVVIWSYSRDLNCLALGDESAAQLGVAVEKTKRILLLAAALITGAAVSVSGTIAFLGLIVPHLVRIVLGPDHRILFPVTALAGAIFLLWADTLARVVFAPSEIPVGVFTAILGGPFFAYLLRKKRRYM